MGRTGVLLMGFGGPDSLDAVAPFCTNLMGREPSAEALERIKDRYRAIGGASPLPAIAADIACKLEAALTVAGRDVPVAVGMRYWHPLMAEGLQRLARAGVTRVVTASLSPFESPASSGAYREAVARAASGSPELTVLEAPSFRSEPAFVGSLADAAAAAVASLPSSARRAVVFTAHSLPVGEGGEERYAAELRETATAVAARAGFAPPAEGGVQGWLPGVEAYGSDSAEVPWLFAYQSKGQRGGEWLGPDIADVLRASAEAGYEAVAVSPVGFATDHMETLYDLDVVAASLAGEFGLAFSRAAVPNDSDRMVEALAGMVGPLLG
jgi:protoporphyrin/coproporphyrin ferrochelatase